jgi:hypothetical protein
MIRSHGKKTGFSSMVHLVFLPYLQYSCSGALFLQWCITFAKLLHVAHATCDLVQRKVKFMTIGMGWTTIFMFLFLLQRNLSCILLSRWLLLKDDPICKLHFFA